MEAKGGYTKAHKYLLGCMDSEYFIGQILTILRRKKRKKKKETLQHLSCHHNPFCVEVFGSCIFHSFSGSRSKTHLMQCLGLSHVFAYELFKMCFVSDY